jgi:hypothetical protein
MTRADEINLEGLSVPELEILALRVAKKSLEQREKEMRELIEKFEKAAEEKGLTPEELMKVMRWVNFLENRSPHAGCDRT